MRKKEQSRSAVFIVVALAVSLLTFCPAAVISAEKDAGAAFPETFSALAAEASPVVVNIRTVKTIKGGGRVFKHFPGNPFGDSDPFHDFFNRFFDDDQQREFKQRSLGSGFIIDQEGYIVTNNHVIEDADEIEVKLKDGREFEASIEGRDPNTDLALIKIKAGENLPICKIGDSDALNVGDWVLAIGSPFGLEHTVTAGIVSAKGRVIGSGPYDDFIQTDASINPGNSGGPLLNMKGEVVGINTAIIASGQGIGFAVPINMARVIIDQLKAHGEVTRGWLGVAIQDLSDEVAEYYGIKEKTGVLVIDVFEGDPADEAGIRPKDIIIGVNGKKVEHDRDLTRMIAALEVGEKARIKVIRDGEEKTFTVKIAKREDEKLASGRKSRETEDELGIRVSNLTSDIRQRHNIADTEGVIVTNVESGGKAAEAGVMAGDIIKEINHQTVKSIDDYRKIIDDVDSGESIDMFIKRANAGFVVVKMKK